MAKLRPCDILVYDNIAESKLLSFLAERIVGKYKHVAMYLGEFCNVPMIYESNGRGVIVQSMLGHMGRNVVVMRPTIELMNDKIFNEALRIASDQNSYYDFLAVGTSCVFRWLNERFNIPIPLKYHRDQFMICSEAIAEVFWRNDIEVVAYHKVPIPGDFIDSRYLEYAYEGKLITDLK